jgi:photosystem II stability/assembly factor-like uncharacterized protein
MRARLLVVGCVFLLASDAGAARTPPHFVPQSIAFWDARHGIATFGACGHVSCLGEIATTSDGGRTWRARRHEPRLGSVFVVRGSRDAWVQTSRGLSYSPDGGFSWRSLPGTRRFSEFSFPTRRVAFALGGEEYRIKLRRSGNGGATWKRDRAPCPRLLNRAAILSFATTRHGWLLCKGQPGTGQQARALYETRSGGAGWRLILRTFGSGYPRGMSMLPSGAGLLWEDRENTYRTSDGGRHWRALSITSPESREGYSGSVVSPQTSFLLVRDSGARFDIELMRSDDGARTWRRVRSWPRR